jgi:hypothetical protein
MIKLLYWMVKLLMYIVLFKGIELFSEISPFNPRVFFEL